MNLELLAQHLDDYSVKDFFNYARNRYLGIDNKVDTFESVLILISKELRLPADLVWASQAFQLSFRATKPNHLKLLSLDEHVEEAQIAIKAGRVMSILPYNVVMGSNTIRKFIPSRSDKFSGNWRHSMDPYGIFRKIDRVVAIDKQGNEIYLATRKFPYAVLANITEACHIGCDGCYKGSMVRTALSALAEVYPEYAQIKKQLNLQEERAVKQAELLVKWLNENPEVDTIVISGGEPTLFSNHALERILEQYASAKFIKVVRMCTSSIFQGMWYRIEDEFVRILKNFKIKSGKEFYINAHVTDDFQLSAPEAKIAINKLKDSNISIHLQMPLQEGINFKRDDLPWSVKKLKRISKLAYSLGVVPYKLIVDMHSPSQADLAVPLETVTKLISFLDQHEYNSDHERWQAYNILHEQGNLYLSVYPHFAAVKEIDTVNGTVTYFIPKLDFEKGKRIAIHRYVEPFVAGHNNEPNSLSKISDSDIIEKIEQVKEYYGQIKDDFTKVKEFYKKSGIKYPENKPLKI